MTKTTVLVHDPPSVDPSADPFRKPFGAKRRTFTTDGTRHFDPTASISRPSA